MTQRIIGFDIARALAVFGMVIVNFKIAMNANTGNQYLLTLSSLFEGRASALFVVLAGIGVTFLTNKARNTQEPLLLQKSRKILIKRGLILIFLGLIYTPIWPADILHFYGFYFLVAAALFHIKSHHLLFSAGIIVMLFPSLMIFFDYEHGWNWTTLSYQNFWTLDGMFRHIFFNGFHPVVPWCAFLLLGMWLGRQNLPDPVIKKRLLLQSITLWLLTELCFFIIRILMINNHQEFNLTIEEISFLFSTSIIPPLPQYIIAAGSLAVAIIITCLQLGQYFSHTKLATWLYKTGQLSLTLYITHVIIGMGILDFLGLLENQNIGFSLLSASIFCLFGIIFSVLWLRYFTLGPLELLFRKLTS